jgi:hypothetical protein
MAKREIAGRYSTIANGHRSGEAEAILRIAPIAVSSASAVEAECNFFIWLNSSELAYFVASLSERPKSAFILHSSRVMRRISLDTAVRLIGFKYLAADHKGVSLQRSSFLLLTPE